MATIPLKSVCSMAPHFITNQPSLFIQPISNTWMVGQGSVSGVTLHMWPKHTLNLGLVWCWGVIRNVFVCNPIQIVESSADKTYVSLCHGPGKPSVILRPCRDIDIGIWVLFPREQGSVPSCPPSLENFRKSMNGDPWQCLNDLTKENIKPLLTWMRYS